MLRVAAIKMGVVLATPPVVSILASTALSMNRNITKAPAAVNSGERIHEVTMYITCFQLTADNPPATIPNPIIAPTMEWVVETGRFWYVARHTQSEAERRADKSPSKIIWGSPMT